MIKNECKIVRDLFPNYIENQVSDETKEFIDGHLKKCSKCSNILKDIKKEANNTNKETVQDKEVNFLKKYNNKMLIAKIIIAILICIIIITGGIGISKLYPHKR